MPHPPPLDPALQQLLDRQAIQDVLVRYCRAVDRADVALLRDCYHSDATEDHGGTFAGSAQAYIDMLAPVLPRAGTLSHTTTNILIEFDGPQAARVESHILAFARLKKAGEKFDSLCLARAVDRFTQRDGAWRIAARQLVWEWNHDMPMAEGWGRGIIAPDASVLLRGRKKPEDPIYQR